MTLTPNFTYAQSSGDFAKFGGDRLVTGYAGNGQWINDPASQNVHGHGPLPQGMYTILRAITHPRVGAIAMELHPFSSNNMFLRSGFFIHGPHADDKRDSSDGCIILPHEIRVALAAMVLQGQNILEVTA
jgi:hypothetical protein